jgi:hypothetical protein
MHIDVSWCLKMGLVRDKDVMEAVRLPDVNGSEGELDSYWDNIL